MEGQETAEDRWFREHVCDKWAFVCAPDETPESCATAKAEACEHQRVAWLGNFTLTAAPPIDTSGTRKETPADEVVGDSGEVSWFDGSTMVGDFSAADEGAFCQTRPSSWQDEAEFDELMSRENSLPFGACDGAQRPAAFADGTYPSTIKGVYLYLMDQVWDEMHPDGALHNDQRPPIDRKDMRTMSNSERVTYLKAVRAVQCLGVVDLWAAIHATSPADLHSGPGFLPAHSIFMRIYEMSLHEFGGLPASQGLAIGGWAVDEALPRWHNGRIRFSAIFGDEFFGAVAEQYIGQERLHASSDVFTDGAWATPSPAADASVLQRSFRNVERRGGYISAQMIWAQLAIEDPLTFACQIERSILHGGHHMVIGGHMGNLLAASNDPLFFAHHGFVDCVWRSWQAQAATREERSTRDSFPAQTPQWWSRHRPEHTAHWTRWQSPASGETRELTHADAWNYRNRGRGAYRCVVPSLLPCHSDEDCGVPAGQAREDKRLYCSVAGVCAQYVERNAICRNEYGSFLPCRRTTDRCQYAPSLFAALNRWETPTEAEPSAWFCVDSPALRCGAHADAGSCAGADGCRWADADAGVQHCSREVPAFGFGVVESAGDTVQSFGAAFDFRDRAAYADPQSGASGGASWQIDADGVRATLTPVRVSLSGGWTADAALRLWRNAAGFGVNESGVGRRVECPSGGGDATETIDRSEGVRIDFDRPVTLERLRFSKFGGADEVEINLLDGDELVAIQRFANREVVFGASAASEDAHDCPLVDGRPRCRVTSLVLFHVAATTPSLSSDIGQLDGSRCRSRNPGAGFSLDSLVVSPVAPASGGDSSGTASSFGGYCTGAPGGDYTDCANVDRCFMSPPASAGASGAVQVILVPAGECGPKGWFPQIDYELEGDGASGRRLVARYKSECACGSADEVLTGSGPLAGADAEGKVFRPPLPLERQQDRLGGNDDARRKASLTPQGESASAARATGAAAVAMLAALFAWLM